MMSTLVDTISIMTPTMDKGSVAKSNGSHNLHKANGKANGIARANSNRNANGNANWNAHGKANGNSIQRFKPRKYNHIFPIHSKGRTSCLSQETDEAPSYVGFWNLVILMLVFSNLRLMIENIRKYGVLICIRCHDYRRQDIICGSMLFVLVPFQLLIAYIIERFAAQQAKEVMSRRKKTDDSSASMEEKQREFANMWYITAVAHAFNATLSLIVATTSVYYYIHHPGIGTICEMHAVIVWLKTCSYALSNRDLRHAYLSPDDERETPELYRSCPYPQNISLKNLSYFWCAPTLVYQPVYPRTERIRWTFVLKRSAEVIILSITIWIASAQYAVPLLENSLDHMAAWDVTSILERVMKLSTISLFCWLAGFFALFQAYLNVLAEVTRFADREFYSDWWNVTSIRIYWTSWNKPVYHFMKRHIYAPLISRGVGPKKAQIIVFVFSGFLHELLVGVPTHNVIGIAFVGMMVQIPLIFLTDPLQKAKNRYAKVAGNMFFWLSFCLVGQPLAALIYFFAWQAKYGSTSRARINM